MIGGERGERGREGVERSCEGERENLRGKEKLRGREKGEERS